MHASVFCNLWRHDQTANVCDKHAALSFCFFVHLLFHNTAHLFFHLSSLLLSFDLCVNTIVASYLLFCSNDDDDKTTKGLLVPNDKKYTTRKTAHAPLFRHTKLLPRHDKFLLHFWSCWRTNSSPPLVGQLYPKVTISVPIFHSCYFVAHYSLSFESIVLSLNGTP